MSLRRRLVLGMIVLMVAGLVTTDLVTSSSLRSFLLGRLDEQIEVTQSQAYGYIYSVYQRDLSAGDRQPVTDPRAWLDELGSPPPSLRAPAGAAGARSRPPHLALDALANRVSPETYVEVLAGGRVVFRDPSGSPGDPDPAPVVPAHLRVQHLPPPHVFGRDHGPYEPVGPSVDLAAAGSGGVQYRAQAVAVPGGVLLTADSLDPTDKTLSSLAHVEAAVSAGVIVALLGLALWIVRIGLRPLDEMTEAAGAIGRGDLTRRIRGAETGEVGRLGTALNAMLSQIEAAFAERTSSESRLRRFVADASHELRTPLTSIRGYAELLRKGALDGEEARARAAERIEGEAARMSLLVDDLLLLARLDQGRPLERQPIDLCRVVADAVEAWRLRAAEDHPSTVELDGPVMVDGDPMRLRQIVDNLLRNAATHTPPGTPVRVTVARRGTTAVLEVADEGPGLEPDQALHVFDRFYRASPARTGEGAGLGLAIVAALAAAHGGSARVRSTPGRGALFTVELPGIPGPRPGPPAGEDARPGGSAPAPDGPDTPDTPDVEREGRSAVPSVRR